MPTAVLLPGQGSQTPDDRDVVLHGARDVLGRVVALTGRDPFDGRTTADAQPAIFCTSVALWRARPVEDVAAFAGHSLGELTALALAGALALEDAVALVVLRGRLMARARAGGMLALRADLATAARVAAESGTVVANDNAPGQVVLAGAEDALVAAAREAAARGVRSTRLPVAGAFHSPLMAEATAPFARALREVAFREPSAPVLCCATARPFDDPPRQLAEALTAPVRWREVVHELTAMGADRFEEVGPGSVLAGLVRRTLREVPSAVA